VFARELSTPARGGREGPEDYLGCNESSVELVRTSLASLLISISATDEPGKPDDAGAACPISPAIARKPARCQGSRFPVRFPAVRQEACRRQSRLQDLSSNSPGDDCAALDVARLCTRDHATRAWPGWFAKDAGTRLYAGSDSTAPRASSKAAQLQIRGPSRPRASCEAQLRRRILRARGHQLIC
jgi:hypothetical protein